MPAPLRLLLLVLALIFLVTFVQIGALTVAFDKLGLSAESAYLLLLTLLVGSSINVPLFSVKAELPPSGTLPPPLRGLFRMPPPFTGRTVVAVNVGGCITPLAFCIYLLVHNPMSPIDVIGATAIVAAVSHALSRPIPGVGIATPIFVPPLTAALMALLINPEMKAPLAYISGTVGVLVGADLMRLKDIRRLGAPLASIGGAGTFDGIFITGIIAVLLT